jgi:outer membrane protein OmpA-like peptidoglycan-associated protein
MRTIRALCLPLLSAAGLSLLPAIAHAQTSSAAQKGEFTVQRFEPAPGTNNFLTVEGVRMDGRWGFSAGVLFDYAKDPFVVQSCASGTDCSAPNATNTTDTHVVSDMFTWNLMAAVSPAKFLQVGLRLPLVYVSGEGINPDTGRGAKDGLKTFGLGDATLEGKVRVLGGAQDPYLLGLAADLSFPTGHATGGEGSYLGNSSPVTGGIRAIFDAHIKAFSIGANLRGVFRESGTLGTTTIGPVDFRYGAALGYRISPIFKVLAEGFGSTQFQFKRGTNGLEADAAVEVRPLNLPVSFRAGGGAGILSGVGVPVARALVGVTYIHEIGDQDGDGIPDDKDQCPTIAEDKDGFEDSDGCPDLDNDGDGIPDDKDKCPNQPETVNGVDDADGCPDEVADRDKDGVPDDKDKCPEAGGKDVINRPGPYFGCPDTDHDGVPDYLDKCPKEAEDTDGFEDTDGCPDPDNDGDGIPDDQDECIDQPEVINGYKDTDGCPDVAPDRDHDGIPDNVDKCPDKPENYNGFEDDDGCPDKGVALVQVGDEGIKILQRVEFATSSDKIQGPKSFQVLDAVVGALKGHPDIFVLEVAGHTDNAGGAADNRALSQKRADAVVAYMTSKGIEAKRLQAKGYGPDKPLADNKTILGRQKNRRVEFNILRSAKNPGVVTQPPAPPAQTPAPAPAPAPGKPVPGKPAPKK